MSVVDQQAMCWVALFLEEHCIVAGGAALVTGGGTGNLRSAHESMAGVIPGLHLCLLLPDLRNSPAEASMACGHMRARAAAGAGVWGPAGRCCLAKGAANGRRCALDCGMGGRSAHVLPDRPAQAVSLVTGVDCGYPELF